MSNVHYLTKACNKRAAQSYKTVIIQLIYPQSIQGKLHFNFIFLPLKLCSRLYKKQHKECYCGRILVKRYANKNIKWSDIVKYDNKIVNNLWAIPFLTLKNIVVKVINWRTSVYIEIDFIYIKIDTDQRREL